uniref:AlNc14C17G1828 protein n=1 Tax=Albugo laibachii Nc14 TaxID=890382 RepID=F0W4K8_9STRA|nr:AlNc14C17G1828 [Albugo laibachii Nc14]|eukprot:CCA16041.1 AlNc14C17G1828 [Albugo laibachii Nc14]
MTRISRNRATSTDLFGFFQSNTSKESIPEDKNDDLISFRLVQHLVLLFVLAPPVCHCGARHRLPSFLTPLHRLEDVYSIQRLYLRLYIFISYLCGFLKQLVKLTHNVPDLQLLQLALERLNIPSSCGWRKDVVLGVSIYTVKFETGAVARLEEKLSRSNRTWRPSLFILSLKRSIQFWEVGQTIRAVIGRL